MEAHSLPRNGGLFLPRSPKVLRAFSDERLVEQLRRGNKDAFEVVYDRHHRGILAFCRHMLSSADEAEDAVQQTFISAYDAIRADAREIRLKPWLYAIARNRCLSILRARREQPAELEEVATAGLSDEVQQRSDLRDLLQDLHALPVDQRAALVLSEVGGLSHAEVGTVVGCEVAKVKSLVFQARSSLIETRRAREIPCHEIREQLATATGGALRRGTLRRHLRACEGCSEFRDEVSRQRKALAAILPVVPTVGLKGSLLASIGLGGGSGGAAIGGGIGGGIASLAGSSAAVKLTTVAVVTGMAVGGGIVLNREAPTKQAEAAAGQPGGGQAWPAPAAGTGPGAANLTPASNKARNTVPGGNAHKTVSKHPASSGPAKRQHAAHGPTARHGVKQHGRRHHHHGTHVVMTAPPPAAAAPPASTPAPAPTSTSHGHGGRHQGRGHDHHTQDVDGTHVPGGRVHQPHPVPDPAPEAEVRGDNTNEYSQGDESPGDGHRRGHHGDDGQ